MDKEYIKNNVDSVSVTVASRTNDDSDLHLNDVYDMILNDIVKVVNMHGGFNGMHKTYKLCPRWELGTTERRDVHIDAIVPMKGSITGESQGLGTIRIMHNPSQNMEKEGFVHRRFDLGFLPAKNVFISPTEFYDLYRHEAS